MQTVIAIWQNVVMTSPYIQAWLIYIAGAIGCLLVFWRMTESVWTFLKLFLRAIVATILLMPFRMQAGEDYWVPTNIFVLMKLVGHDLNAAMPGIRQLLLVAVALIVMTWLVQGVLYYRHSARQRKPRASASEPAATASH